MPIELIKDMSDPRLRPFLAMKDRELAREGGKFIAEGEHLVRRLLASGYATESVLVAQRRADEMAGVVPDDVPLLVAPAEMLNRIVGFKFHSGVLACGQCGPARSLEQTLPTNPRHLRIVVCEDISNAENLGGIVRISAGFGADLLVLGQRCINPFFRQCIRVSMGTIFRLPLVQSKDLLADLAKLRDRWNVELIATVLDADGQPLARARPSPRVGLLFGGEAQGLTPAAIAACDRRLTIPMKLGTDSLNVAVAAGIFLYHFCSE